MEIKFLDFSYMHQPLRARMIQQFEEVYDSYWYILGKRVAAFEKQFADYSGAAYCAGVANGLDAIVLCLNALGIQEGDEVIVPSNTYIATWLAVSIVGARPVPVEPRLATYNLDPELIEVAITSKTRAIIPVHLYGQSCEMKAIMDVSKKHNLFVVEDNAQAQGARYQGRITGSWGHANATSFYPGKNLGALGDGGATTTDNAAVHDRISTLRNYGSKKKYYNDEQGINSRLDELQAALLSVKLTSLNDWNRKRQEIAETYRQLLNGVGDLVLPQTAPLSESVYHLFVIRTKKRNELQAHLKAQGIETMIHYPVPPHLQQAYQALRFRRSDFPIAEQIADSCLSLPIYPGLNMSSIEYIAAAIKKFF